VSQFTFADTRASIRDLKHKYETKLAEYQSAIRAANQRAAAQIQKELNDAKAAYEKAKAAITPSKKAQGAIQKTTEAAVDTVGDVFAQGTIFDGLFDGIPIPGSGNTLIGFASQKAPKIDGDNYCGQFATSMALRYYKINHDPQEVYRQANPAGIFTSPSALVESLNMNGLDANVKHNAGLEDIAKKIDSKAPVIVLVGTESGSPHWVAIHSYQRNYKGEIISVTMRDSYWGYNRSYTMKADEFQEKWANPLGTAWYSGAAGYKNLMVDIKGKKTPDSSPSLFGFNFNYAAEETMAGGINDAVTGWKRKSPTQMLSGAVKTVVGLPGVAVKVAGNYLNKGSDSLIQGGIERWNNGNKVGGALRVAVGGLGKGVSFVSNTVANTWGAGVNIIGNGIKKLGYIFK